MNQQSYQYDDVQSTRAKKQRHGHSRTTVHASMVMKTARRIISAITDVDYQSRGMW